MANIIFSKKERASAITREALGERLNEFADFYQCYEELVGVLCDAAQFGGGPKLEREYSELSRQMKSLYPPVRPFLISYLEFVPNDVEAGLKLCGRPLDAFEVLVAAVDLREFFHMDDGTMISRLTRTREAITLYGEHLRLLAARLG